MRDIATKRTFSTWFDHAAFRAGLGDRVSTDSVMKGWGIGWWAILGSNQRPQSYDSVYPYLASGLLVWNYNMSED